MNTFDLHFIFVIIMGAFIGGAAGYLGSLMLTKKMALVGGAFGHLALPGIALALVYGFDVSIGALIFLMFGMLLMYVLEKKSNLSIEILSAVIFTSSLSVAWIFLPEKKAPALIGDITAISWNAIIISIVLALVIMLLTKKIIKPIILSSFSKDISSALGLNIGRYNFLFLSLIVLVTSLGVRIIGGLMTVALIAIPAATSRNISNKLLSYTINALMFGFVSAGLGVYLSSITSLPPGSLIVMVSAVFFVVSLFFRKDS